MSKKFDYTAKKTLSWEAVAKAMLASQQRLAETDVVFKDGGRGVEPTRLPDSARAWKVWSACLDLTAGYQKRSDKVHVATIGSRSGVRPDKVSPILRAFHAAGVFSWVKEEGSRSAGILSLPSLKEPDDKPKPKSKPRKKCGICGSKNLWEAIWDDPNQPPAHGCDDCGAYEGGDGTWTAREEDSAEPTP